MHRLLLVTTDAFGALGGIAQYNRDLALAISRHPSVEELVIVPRNLGSEVGELPPQVRQDMSGVDSLGRFAAAVARCALLPHLGGVICGHVNLLPFAAAVAAARRAPLALMLYGIEVWEPPKRRVVSALASRVRQVASISDLTLQRFRAWAGSRADAALLPNAIDLAAYGPGPRAPALLVRYGLEDASPVLLTFARLSSAERYKGFDEMIALLPRLAEAHPQIRYIIAGDGDDRGRLEQLVSDRGQRERVVFTGRVSEAEKQDLYRLADVFAMPGRGEGFGFVFLEALACGVPVVASRLDGSREAVRDGLLGELCDPRDPSSLYDAIQVALTKPHGVVPEGLSYFDFPSFEQRVHAWLDSWVEPP